MRNQYHTIVKASQKHNIWVDLWRDLWEVINEESEMSFATPPYIFWASLKNTNVVSLDLFSVSFKSVCPSISSIYFYKICIYPAPAYCHATLWSLTACQLSGSRSSDAWQQHQCLWDVYQHSLFQKSVSWIHPQLTDWEVFLGLLSPQFTVISVFTQVACCWSLEVSHLLFFTG